MQKAMSPRLDQSRVLNIRYIGHYWYADLVSRSTLVQIVCCCQELSSSVYMYLVFYHLVNKWKSPLLIIAWLVRYIFPQACKYRHTVISIPALSSYLAKVQNWIDNLNTNEVDRIICTRIQVKIQ